MSPINQHELSNTVFPRETEKMKKVVKNFWWMIIFGIL